MFDFIYYRPPILGEHDLGIMPEDYAAILDEALLNEIGHRWEPHLRLQQPHRPTFTCTQHRAVWARTDIESRLYASVSDAVAAIVPQRGRRANGSTRPRSGDRGDSDAHDHQLLYISVLLASARTATPRVS